MNPVDIVADQFKGAGIAAQYKRRCKDGTLEDATEKELEVLKVQSRIAAAAQQLQHIAPQERTTWAVEIKDYANALYSQGLVADAMNKYTEALTASDFSKANGNLDVLVIPVLCNLAACCIQIEEYGKGVRFCDQALALKPECGKAHMRRGICFFHLGEFDRSLVSLKKSLRIVDACLASDLDDVTSSEAGHQGTAENRNTFQNGKVEIESRMVDDDSTISENKEREKMKASKDDASAYKLKEKQKIQSYISKTEKNIEVQKSNILQQKKAMQKLFSSSDGLGEIKRGDKSDCARKRSKPDTCDKRASHIEASSTGNGNILTALRDFFTYLLSVFLSFFVSPRTNKSRKK